MSICHVQADMIYLISLLFLQVSEWLLTNEHFVTHIMARTSYIQWNDDNDDDAFGGVHFVLDQLA